VRCPATITNRIGFHHAVAQLPKSGITYSVYLRLTPAIYPDSTHNPNDHSAIS
jgi:hypothetical protein